MIFDDATYQLIEKYLQGRMTLEESSFFIQRMENDSELKQHVIELKELAQLIGESETENPTYELNETKNFEAYKNYFESKKANELQGILNEVSKEFSAPKKKVFYLTNRFRVIAASFIGILLVVTFLQTRNPNPSKLYASNMVHEPISWVEKGNEEVLLFDAQEAFNKQQYKLCKEKLEQLLKLNPVNDEALLYLAICLQELNKFNEASDIYLKLIESNSLFSENAYWYLSLVELKNENFNQTLYYIAQIEELSSDNKLLTKAEALKKKVKYLEK